MNLSDYDVIDGYSETQKMIQQIKDSIVLDPCLPKNIMILRSLRETLVFEFPEKENKDNGK